MKKRGIILTILIIVALMAVSGSTEEDCDSSQENKGQIKESSSVNEDLKYITYKRDEIIENVEKLNLEIGMESAMYSRKIVLEDIKKYLPIDNIRKISGGFLIEYPMEDRNIVITSSGEIIAGREAWNKFYMLTKGNELTKLTEQITEELLNVRNQSILIKTYYGDNNFFEEETEENVSGFIEQIIVYDGKQFLVNKWENGENKISTYKYLVERKGRMPNAAVGEHGFYLVNDNSLTYEQLQWSSLSSQCSDYIDYYTVFYEIYYE